MRLASDGGRAYNPARPREWIFSLADRLLVWSTRAGYPIRSARPLVACGLLGKDATKLKPFLLQRRQPRRRRSWRARCGFRSLRARCGASAPTRRLRAFACAALAWLALAGTAAAEIVLPAADPQAPIHIRADQAQHWRRGDYEVWLLRGGCELLQAGVRARGGEAVLWIDRSEPLSGRLSKIIAYLEGGVTVDYAGEAAGARASSVTDTSWLGRFHTSDAIEIHAAVAAGEPAVKPAVYQHAMAARNPPPPAPVQHAQYLSGSTLAAPAVSTGRRVTIRGRSNVRPQAEIVTDPARNETVAMVVSGVSVIVEGIEAEGFGEIGKIDIETDRLVVWTANLETLQLSGETLQQGNTPLEFYMEGNIVFRQGDRVIYAERMYYNVTEEYGIVLDAEMLTPVPEYEGLLRLKAEVLQQLDRRSFQAFGAAATSSRLGVPRYWFQSENISFQDIQLPRIDPFTGQAAIDRETGQPAVDHQLKAVSRNNILYAGSVPVFYWPVLATDLTKPTYYLDRIRINNDRVFGFQALADWDVYQLLGVREPPAGTQWGLSTDYLSLRGPALGTTFSYDRDTLFGVPSPYVGYFDAWGLRDQGLDNLGAGRRAVPLEANPRGRILWRHRQHFPANLRLTGELGLISDRNFLNQYFKQEWDEAKDADTSLELKQVRDNSSWSVRGDVRLNDFFTQTEWLPRADHFLYGQSVLFDRLTWFAHSQIGYGRARAADPPTNPVDLAVYSPLPWEADREGIRAATRQELDWPVELGPVKVTPYVLGEAARWGEDLAAQEATRFFGQAGVRTSLPIWRVDPGVYNTLFNLRGLAHKVTLEGEFFWADANRDLGMFPLYDRLDDNAQQQARRRYAMEVFGGATPPQYDDRFTALRSGLQRWVTAPSTEVADDLMVAQLAVRQRWQTKRGLPGQERIVDWIVLDLQGSFFPRPDRDNFGADAGLLGYDFRWHVGDRVTLVSDAYADVFSDGLRKFTAGGFITRPEQGQAYLGFRTIEGPISSNVLDSSVSYRMSEKWILTAGSSIDFAKTGNVGQMLALTRVGESMLFRIGFNYDKARDNVGVHLAIEPRFLPSSRMGRVGGVRIPPAGAEGLE